MHCSAFLVGGLKRAPQIFFLNFFVWVVLFGHNYGPVNQKKTHQNFSCKVGKSTSICAIDLAVQHTQFVKLPKQRVTGFVKRYLEAQNNKTNIP